MRDDDAEVSDPASGRSDSRAGTTYVEVTEGPAAVQAAVDDGGPNEVVVYGDEAEWNETVYLPSDTTLAFRDGVTITSSMTAEDTDTFEVGHGTVGAALITNADHENGNRNVTVRGGVIDFEGVTDDSVIWAPVWLHECDHSRFESIHVENVAHNYGPMFTDCRDSSMLDCVGRNVGYDGIAVRLDCRRIDVYRCEAYDCGGPGIQAATFGNGAGAPHDVSFVNCRTPESIFVHGYQEPGGARGVLVQGCTAGKIAMIGHVQDFLVTGCKTTAVGLSCLHDTIRNGRIDAVAFSDLYGSSHGAALRFRSWEDGRIENVAVSNCTARSWGDLRRFGETFLDESSTARYVDVTDCSFDGVGADGDAVFFEHGSDGDVSNVRVHGCKVWNASHVIGGPIDGVRVRDCELHDVRALHDDVPTGFETRDNDWW